MPFDHEVIFFGFLPSSIPPKCKGVTIIWAIGENTFRDGAENMVENFPGPPFNKTIKDGDIAPWLIWNNLSNWPYGKIWTERKEKNTKKRLNNRNGEDGRAFPFYSAVLRASGAQAARVQNDHLRPFPDRLGPFSDNFGSFPNYSWLFLTSSWLFPDHPYLFSMAKY